MRTEPLVSQRHLFVFAHPDDEFACLESIHRSVSGGARVICVYLTNGAFGGQSVERRVKESRAVLAKLGVRVQDIHFPGVALGIPDSALPDHLESAFSALNEILTVNGHCDEAYTPAWEGGHQDHDASHIVTLALKSRGLIRGDIWQFPLYNGAGLAGPLFRVLHPLPHNGALVNQPLAIHNRLRYLRLCLCYPSQWKTWLGLFPFVSLTLLLRGSYTLQRVELHKAIARPHAGALLFERRTGLYWNDLAQKYLAFLDCYR